VFNGPAMAKGRVRSFVRDPLRIRRWRLVTSPLDWQMTAAPVPHPLLPVVAERGETQLRTPLATVLVDTRDLYHWLESNEHGRYLSDEDL
jgi:hypothetical protein